MDYFPLRSGLAGFVLALLAAAPCAAEEILSRELPISLDADSSEIDRGNDRLVFRNVTISQGETRINAREAVASTLDFANSVWTFEGDVEIRLAGTSIASNQAQLTFTDYNLQGAVVEGSPARFEHVGEERQAEGRANLLEYDAAAGIVRLSREAWLAEDGKEISGNVLTYDIIAERVVADRGEDEDQRVRIIIDPASLEQEREDDSDDQQ